jgi:hypothetical protein
VPIRALGLISQEPGVVPSAPPWVAETQRMLDQALTLVDLAETPQTKTRRPHQND